MLRTVSKPFDSFFTAATTRSPLPQRRVAKCVIALADLLYKWQTRIEQRDHLASLDSRLLSDMGVTRADVMAEMEKPFWRA